VILGLWVSASINLLFFFSVLGIDIDIDPLIINESSLHHGKLWLNYIDKVSDVN
jgi:hypothetical protein